MTHERTGPLARIALALTAWSERWVPDAFIFALIASAVVVLAGVGATEATVAQVVDAWGRGFWDLIPFTLQMALVIITWFVVALGGTYLVRYFAAAPESLNAINLNALNLGFLLLGFLLHGTPARLMRAVQDATPAVWGVILQFPFYAGIAGVITGTHLNEQLAAIFVRASTAETFPALVAVYSAVLGVFVPSGGSKWVIEAPYVMAAAHELKVHLGWVVAAYDLGEALANLVQPFWMLPILGLFQLRARDIMGFTFLVFVVLFPVVILLVTLLGMTLHYPL